MRNLDDHESPRPGPAPPRPGRPRREGPNEDPGEPGTTLTASASRRARPVISAGATPSPQGHPRLRHPRRPARTARTPSGAPRCHASPSTSP